MPIIRQQQRKISIKTDFKYGEEDLQYTIKKPNGSRTFVANYASITVANKNEMVEQNAWLRNAGILCLIIGVVHRGILILEADQLQTLVWLVSGAICLIIHAIAKTEFTVLSCDIGDILIIKDSKHDKVLEEIRRRRKNLIMGLYGDINIENNPEDEVAKFLWLKDQGYISEKKLHSIIEQIKEHTNRITESFTDDGDEGKTIN